MKNVYLGLLASFISLSASAEMVAIEPGSADQVYVLKHPDPQKGVAFVKVTDQEKLSQLLNEDGYELVVQGEDAEHPAPVTGKLLSEKVVEREVQKRGLRDQIDLGIGFGLLMTTGPKVRVLATLESGLIAGVDLDAGTAIVISDAAVSALVGWEFRMEKNKALRLYGTAGLGKAVKLDLSDGDQHGKIVRLGLGVEWKPAKWFGLGFESGIAKEHHFQEETEYLDPYGRRDIEYPYIRGTAMIYY
jgi:hypothetical protein